MHGFAKTLIFLVLLFVIQRVLELAAPQPGVLPAPVPLVAEGHR